MAGRFHLGALYQDGRSTISSRRRLAAAEVSPVFQVLVDGNKYAWCISKTTTCSHYVSLTRSPLFHFPFSESCIKGHRSSTCQHTNRALFEIKRKGRPVTQCDNCRHLRKTKQLHVKCICEGKEDSTNLVLPPALKKGASHQRLLALHLAYR